MWIEHLEHDRINNQEQDDESEGENFNTDLSIKLAANLSEEKSKDGMVVAIVVIRKGSLINLKISDGEKKLTKRVHMVTEELVHFNVREWVRLKYLLSGEDKIWLGH